MGDEGRRHGAAALSVLRVLDAHGDAVGAAFVVGPGRVATCAHVVTAAVGGDPTSPTAPTARLHLDHPLTPGAPLVEAAVRDWRPIDPGTGTGDVAILEVDPSIAATLPPLYRPDRLWGHRFRVLGFPAGMQDGLWVGGELRDRQGTRWLQMQADPHDPPIAAGFSGAPVWAEDVGAVVGMTVAADGKPGSTTAYLLPIEDVIGVDPRLLANPYRGLEPFGEEHAALFYGRDDEVERLTALVERQSLVVVVGGSGTGKSSLVRAGLLPRLRDGGARIVELRPVPFSPESLAVLDGLTGAGSRGDEHDPGPGIVLFVDQFEELVGEVALDSDPAPARLLLERLIDLVRGGDTHLRVLLTLRWEAMNELLTDDTVATFEDGTFLLAPMSRHQLRQAIVGPTLHAPGLAFEDGLVDLVLDEAVDEPGQLPLVEYLLSRLWESRQGGTLEMAAYERLGGVRGAIARQAERDVADLVDRAGGPGERAVRRVLTVLARPDDAAGFVRQTARIDALSPDQRIVVGHLARSRLVVVGQQPDGARTVELAHQALIDHWPRLRGWLDEDREFLVWHHRLGRQRQAWEDSGRDSDALLRGVALLQAEDWLTRRGDDVGPDDQAFVAAGRRRARRDRRRRGSLLAAFGTALVTTVLLGSLFTYQRQVSARERATSDSRAIAALAVDTAASDPTQAIVLALAAYDRHPTAEAESALFGLYTTYRSTETVLSGVAAEITGVDASRDGRVILARTASGTLHLWHRQPGRPVTTDEIPVATAFAVDLSDDGRRLLVAGRQRVEVYDIGRWSSPAWEIPSAPEEVVALHLADDGTVALRSASGGPIDPAGSLELWGPGGRLIGRSTLGPDRAMNPILGLGPRPGTVLAVDVVPGDDDRLRVVTWDAATGAVDPAVVDVGPSPAVSSDGVIVHCLPGDNDQGLGDPQITRVDLRDGSERSFPWPGSTCPPINLTTDADASIAASGDIAVDLTTGDVLGRPDLATPGVVTVEGPVVAEGDRFLTVQASSSAVLIREVPTEPAALPAVRLIGAEPSAGQAETGLPLVQAARLLPDGRHVLTVTGDGAQLVVSSVGDVGERLDQTADAGGVVATAERPPPHRRVSPTSWRIDDEGTLLADRVAADTIEIRRLPGLDLLQTVTTDPVMDDDSARMTWWPDGRLATIDGSTVRWWDPTSGEPDARLDLAELGVLATGADETAPSFTSHPDDPALAVVGAVGDPDLHVVDIATGDEVDTLRVGDDVLAAAYQPGGPYVAVLRQGSRIELWDRETGRRALGPLPSLGAVRAGDFVASFLPEPGHFLFGDGGLLRWYEAGRAAPQRRLDLHPELVPVGASDDGQVVLAVDHRVWPVVLPPLSLDVATWRASLCAVVDDRELTDHERALLPSEVAETPLC